jgi:predicted dehydrogenase
MGWAHARAYRELGCRVALVCDPNLERAKACARDVGALGWTADARDVFARPDIRVVSVASPDHLHFAHARGALSAGQHVMVEKPMVTRLADARALVRMARRARRLVAVGNVNRFVPQFAHVRRLAAGGALGRLFHVESDYIHDMRSMYRATPWRTARRNPQDFWLGGGVHPMDLMRWVGGEIAEIFVYATRRTLPAFPLDSDFIAAVKFRSGATGKLWVTAGIRRRPEHVVRLCAYGERGSIETDFSPVARVYLAGQRRPRDGWRELRFRETHGHPVRDELRHFLGCVAAGRRPLVDAVDGARTIAALAAGLRSAATGRPVRVPRIS